MAAIKVESDRPISLQPQLPQRPHLQSHQILFYHPVPQQPTPIPQSTSQPAAPQEPMNYRPHNHQSMKVNFVYSQQAPAGPKPIQASGLPMARAKNHTFHVERKQSGNYSQPTTHHPVRPKPVISTQKRPLGHIGTETTSQEVSLVNSPVRVKPSPFKQPPRRQPRVTAQEMHIALQ